MKKKSTEVQIVKAEHVGLMVMIRSSSEDEFEDESVVPQERQVEAVVNLNEQDTCLICKEHLLYCEVLINACPHHIFHRVCVR